MSRTNDASASRDAPGTLLLSSNGCGECCTFPSSLVARFERAPSPTPVPGAPDLVCGIVEIRGRILTVLHLGKILESLGTSPLSPTPEGDLLLLLAEPFEHVALAVPEQVAVRPFKSDGALPHLDIARFREILAPASSRALAT